MRRTLLRVQLLRRIANDKIGCIGYYCRFITSAISRQGSAASVILQRYSNFSTTTIRTTTTSTSDRSIPFIDTVEYPTSDTTTTVPSGSNDDDDDKDDHVYNTVLSDALRPYYQKQSPVVLKGFLQQSMTWSTTLSSWKDYSYLTKRIGANQYFDLEVGNDYSKGEKVTIPFSHYIDYLELFRKTYGNKVPNPMMNNHDDDDDDFDNFDESQSSQQQPPPPQPSAEQILYLAQHDLPPGLLSDVPIPKFCCSDPSLFGGLGEGKLYQCMFWMGPPYAYSPLHYDPLCNLLYQVVGCKHVTLVDPTKLGFNASEVMYTGHEYGQQSNTSALYDVHKKIDWMKYPKAPPMHVVAQQTILETGDILFLPAKWWHSARSLDFTISVNMWWR